MANEIGNALLTSLTKSSFDIGNMTKTLAEAEVAGPRAILESKQEKATTELDALKYLKTNLEAFNTYVTDLTSPDLFLQKNATSSDESVVTVSATTGAAQGNYQIESKQIAQSHTLVFDQQFGSASDALSTGTFEFIIGGQTHSLTIDNTNNTLEGLQRMVNNGDYGANASIINTGSGYQLMLSSKDTGAASEISLTAGSNIGELSSFTTTAEAQDAVMVLNGVTVTSSTNSFDSVIDGVSFTLNSAQPGLQKNVSIGQDQQSIEETVSSFIEVYNQLGTIFDELGSYDYNDLTDVEKESPEYEYYGDLAGSNVLRSVRTQVNESMRGILDGLSGGAYRTMADIGVNIDAEGVMSLDSVRFQEAMAANMDAVSNLFARGGSSDDPLINVVGGNDRTLSGSYDLNISQVATRGTVSGGAATPAAGQRVAGDQITDMNAALTIDAGASLSLNGMTYDLSLIAGTYADKDSVAAALEGYLNSPDPADPNTPSPAGVTVAYDSSQARFEITNSAGAVSIDSSIGLNNQGFSGGAYAGEQLIAVGNATTPADATFDVSIDGSSASTITIAEGSYTASELAKAMQSSINANTDVQSAGGEVSVLYDATANAFSVTSNRFGINSSVEMTGFTNFANAGFSADILATTAGATGQNVDGTITTATGSLNIGAYADSDDGRKITISDYAVINGEAAEVRGLEFDVLGGVTGARGAITFSQGFASQLEQTINNLFETDSGLIGQRIEGLNQRMDDYEEKSKTIDTRYERLLMKYQLQFSALQSIMSSTEQTRNYLTATFSNNNN